MGAKPFPSKKASPFWRLSAFAPVASCLQQCRRPSNARSALVDVLKESLSVAGITPVPLPIKPITITVNNAALQVRIASRAPEDALLDFHSMPKMQKRASSCPRAQIPTEVSISAPFKSASLKLFKLQEVLGLSGPTRQMIQIHDPERLFLLLRFCITSCYLFQLPWTGWSNWFSFIFPVCYLPSELLSQWGGTYITTRRFSFHVCRINMFQTIISVPNQVLSYPKLLNKKWNLKNMAQNSETI